MEEKRVRFGMLDSLRGFVLLHMVLFHLLYDVQNIIGYEMEWFGGRAVYWWQQCICWGFVLISGFTWSLGRKPVRRGIQVFLAGLVISGVTYLFLPSERIFFGVLSFLGVSMILLKGVEGWLRRWNPWFGLLFGLSLFGFCKNLAAGYLGFFGEPLLMLPKGWYANYGTAILGCPFPGFYSSDYVPLFPGFFMFLTGYFLWRLLGEEEAVKRFLRKRVPILDWLGKRSLWIYMLHQPVLLGALLGVSYFL